MIVLSNDVKNVLNRIFLIGIAYNGKISKKYSKIKTALRNLDNSIINIKASAVNNAPLSWKRDNVNVIQVENFLFSYKKAEHNDNIIITVNEVAENGKIVTETKQLSYSKKKRLYESIMRDVAKIVKKAIINQNK